MSSSESSVHSERIHIGGSLVFIGGILALVFPIFPIAFVILLRSYVADLFEKIGEWLLTGGTSPALGSVASAIVLFILIGAVATMIFGALTIYAYTLIRRGQIRSGGMLAIATGVAMIVTLHWMAGVITVIGAVLCYRAKPSANP
jgi:hypothetical protein